MRSSASSLWRHALLSNHDSLTRLCSGFLKSNERRGNREVLGRIGTDGACISLTECIVTTQAHGALICKVKTF